MTNPSPDNAWSALDLPVLTDVVDTDTAAEVPVYDFTAELDALAQAVPADEVPELTLPPELTLEDVLGEESAGDDTGLSTSQLIERLPSLDLEVDLPTELSLDDVLPGLEPARQEPAVAATVADDFSFSLQEEAPAQGTTGGLSALFARASFEPVASPTAPAHSVPLVEQASVDNFTAQLDDFDVAADMPELPGDAFLSQADEGAPQTEVFAADSRDDEWAGTWEPPKSVEPPLLTADDLELPPDLPTLVLPAASELADDAVSTPLVVPAPEALPWEVDTAASLAVPNLSLSVDEILASLQPAESVVTSTVGDAAIPTFPLNEMNHGEPDEVIVEATPLADLALPPAEAWLPDEPASPVPPAAWLAEIASTDTRAAVIPPPLPAVSAWPVPDVTVSAVESHEPAVLADMAPVTLNEPEAPEAAWPDRTMADVPVASPPDVAPLQSISLDSLPTGVLGGGLGLAAAATTVVAANLGQPAAQLPGGGDWPLNRPAFDAGDKEVELAWARDLGAEPPLDLDELPPAQTAPDPQPVIAEVIRVRRSHAQPEVVVPASRPAEVQAASVVANQPSVEPEDGSIHIEAVSEALPLAPLTTVMAAAPAMGTGLDEEALIDALYARVLPRMKVELTLWMQDALEQQAKQLMAGVMKQLKEDFDMMLAESLRSSLREALDEAAGKQEGQHD